VPLPVEKVIKALRHEEVRPLPRGELFIDRDFLTRFFNRNPENHLVQLKSAAKLPGLSALGVDMNRDYPPSFFSDLRRSRLHELFLVGWLNGPVSGLIQEHGFIPAMLNLKRDQARFSSLGDTLLHRIQERAKQARENGLNALALADDIAGERGLFFSTEFFRKVVLPIYKKIAETIKESGLFAFFHSDGDIRRIVTPLIDAGYDCLHPIDHQAGLNLYDLKEEFSEKISFMGHLDLIAWDAEAIRREIEKAEKEFTRGGLILGSAGGLSGETKPEKLRLLYSANRS
jgi:uroporphyrinogen decarboxylase